MTVSVTAQELAREVGEAAARSGAARTLLLDVDGTLAPIAPTPESAAVPHGTLRAVARLVSGGFRVVAVSGRPLDQVRQMVPVEGIDRFGSHGLEGELDGREQPLRLADETRARLGRLLTGAEELAASEPGVRAESKPAGIALHDRLVEDERVAAWRQRVGSWVGGLDLDGLEVLEGKRVLEIRPAGVHKGRVVRVLARHQRVQAPDASFVALGDDVTDEDMFREIRRLGLGVRVGPAGTETAAGRRLESTGEVERFLTLLSGRRPEVRAPRTSR